ncbi:MAG: hypothetical protein WBG17_00905 [Burkholderiaceae bacterium]
MSAPYTIQTINDPSAPAGVHFRVTDSGDNRVATCYAEQNAQMVTAALNQRPLTDNLALLVARLAYALHSQQPGHLMARRASEYLQRHNLIGSPLRMVPANDNPATAGIDVEEIPTIVAQPAPVLDAPTWKPITASGQVKVGDKLRFTIGSRSYRETAKLILHPATDREEIIYNKRQNYYLITSMAIKDKGSQKNVEFMSVAQQGGAQ